MGAKSSKVSVLLLGLNNAGKSSLLYHCLLGSAGQHGFHPTKGFNYEVLVKVFQRRKFELHMWDMAGKRELRTMWAHFYRVRPDVVLFVVDANDRNSMAEARSELQRVLHEPELRHSMKVVISNVKRKDDSKVSEDELRELLGLTRDRTSLFHASQPPPQEQQQPQATTSDVQGQQQQPPSANQQQQQPQSTTIPVSQQQNKQYSRASSNVDDVTVIELNACDSIGLESVVNVICSRTMEH